jgi:biopolymer transport protein ExbD
VEKARQSGVVYIFIGKPVDEQGRVLSDETRIQVNDRLVHVGQIGEEIDKARAVMAEDDRPRLVVSLQADRDTEMGIINNVKQALREAGALNINYSATNRNKKIQ